MTRPLTGAALAAVIGREERLQRVLDDYPFLIETGETHRETLARRLNFTSADTFERYLYRNDIPLLHGVIE